MTRDQILDAALRRLAASGYRALSLRGIARELGVTLGTVQHHFPTKANLWRGAVDRGVARSAPPEISVPAAGSDPVGDWRERVRTLVDRAAREPGLTAALFADTDDGADERLRYVAGRVHGTLDAARGVMAEATTNGRLRPVQPEALLGILSLGLTSLAGSPEAVRALLGIDLTDDSARAELADGVADLLLFGLAPR